MTCVDRRIAAASLCLALCLGACGPSKDVKKVAPAVVRDVPQALRGTIGAEANFHGIDPVLVSGLGIVVGLNGTGGADNLDQAVQATMERQLAMGGIGKGAAGANYPSLAGLTPSEFLRSKDVAVVIVEARIPPGAPKGSPFDVYVRTLPGSSVTSLEGGSLWTTDLRIGPAAVFGAVKARKLAEAKGPIFINPFSGPSVGAGGEVKITRIRGRILAGGKVTEPLQILVQLDNESSARARSIVGAINSRFPREADDEGQAARGRGSGGGATYQQIALRVPGAYTEKPEEFLQLVRHLRVDAAMPEEFARRYAEEMKASPALSADLGWCMQSIGRTSLPFLVPLYEYPELAPRMAALEAGARLGDARAAGPLIDLARRGPGPVRVAAMKLLGDMPVNPSINLALREIVAEPTLEIRVAAYEALRARHDPTVESIPVGDDPGHPKFALELVPGGEPLVYVTQQGEPRIVLLGAGERRSAAAYGGIRIEKPVLVNMWNGQFMLTAGLNDDLRAFYRDPRTGQASQSKVPETLPELIQVLGHKPTPEDPRPGLGLTYSQVVGVLYEMCPRAAKTGEAPKSPALAAAFATEEDQLAARIYEAMQVTALVDRPETEAAAARQGDLIFRPQEPGNLGGPATLGSEVGDYKSKVVRLKKPEAK